MDNEQYIESGLSVGTMKIANKYEIFTEEEIDAINNKIPELDERVDVIEDEIEEINSSLDDKADEIKSLNVNKMDKNTKDISITQINKNLGKLDQSYLADSLLQQIAGNTPINSVPADKSITSEKIAQGSILPNNTAFISTINNNLLANELFYGGKAINYLDGTLLDNDYYDATDFIKVESGRTYHTRDRHNYALYDADKNFVSGGIGGYSNYTFTIPDGVEFIRLTLSKDPNAYFYDVTGAIHSLEELKASNIEFESLIKRIAAKASIDMPLRKDNENIMGIFESSLDNLVSYDTLRKHGYYTNRGWNAYENYNSSQFIKVEPLTEYWASENNVLVMYDEDFVPIKQYWGPAEWGNVNTFTTTSTTKYVTLNFRAGNNNPILVKGNGCDSDEEVYLTKQFFDAFARTIEFESLIKRIAAKASIDMPLRKDNENIMGIFESSLDNLVSYDTLRKHGYYTNRGWNAYENYNSSQFIKVEPLTEYWASENNVLVMYDEDFVPIKQYWGPAEWGNVNTFTTTSTTKYVTLNFRAGNNNPILVKGNGCDYGEEVYLTNQFFDAFARTIKDEKAKLDLSLISPFKKIPPLNLYNPNDIEAENTAVNINTGGTYTVENYQATGFIEVSGEYLCCSQKHNFAFYNSNKQYITGGGGGWDNPLSIPANAKYVRVTFNMDHTERQVNLGKTLLPYTEPISYGYTVDDSNEGKSLLKLFSVDDKLKGIKWNVLGDSITSVNYSRPNWWETIRDKHGMIVNCYGISGTTLAHTDERHLYDYEWRKLNATEIGYVKDEPSTWSTGNCFCERYIKMEDDADLITVMGSTNDNSVMLGEWDSTDTSTFYGALNVLITGLMAKYPSKKVAIFTPIQTARCYRTNVANPSAELDKKAPTHSLSVQLRAEAIKRKCRQYGIPCLDLFNTSGINGLRLNLYRNDDALHPSKEGNDVMAVAIENFILSLFN